MSSPDRYDIEARYAPALVCTVPFLLLSYYYLNGLDSGFWQSAFTVKVGSLGLSAAIFFTLVHFCRAVGKFIEEKLYRNGLSMPTTEFLLESSNSLSHDRKRKVINKINDKFNIDLTTRTEDSDINRRLIHESVGQVRSMFYKKNEMLLQRNIQFGFSKNLLGGSILALFVSILGYILSALSSNEVAKDISLVLIAMYSLAVFASYMLMNLTAKHYALTLYEEFLADKG